jgi:putative heme-binding domain-containing protein
VRRLPFICGLFAVAVWLGPAVAAQHSYSQADIDDGGRLYQSNCARCHGPDGDVVSGVNLGRGQFKRVTTDDEIVLTIIKGVPGTGMPPGTFSDAEAGTIVAFLRSLASAAALGPATAGDASRGKALFDGRGQCLTCHSVGGRGSRMGPDLDDVGLLRRAVDIERSIVDPNADVLMDYRVARVVTRDGATIRGRLLNQDLFTIQLLDANERLVSFDKSSLRSSEILKESAMPSYKARLSALEVADLVAYLRSLREVR